MHTTQVTGREKLPAKVPPTRNVPPRSTTHPVSPGFRRGLLFNRSATHCSPFTPLLQNNIHAYTLLRMANDTTKTFIDAPLAFFLTWTTYGSWLPGDARGWVDDHGIIRAPNERLVRVAGGLMREPSVVLAVHQRQTVECAIHEQCQFRGWMLHAVSCRATHVHTVVSATETTPEVALRCLKAWCSRQLSAGEDRPRKWWTKGGSMRRLYDTRGIEAVIEYVVECQDRPHH